MQHTIPTPIPPHPMGELDNFIFLFNFLNEKNVYFLKD